MPRLTPEQRQSLLERLTPAQRQELAVLMQQAPEQDQEVQAPSDPNDLTRFRQSDLDRQAIGATGAGVLDINTRIRMRLGERSLEDQAKEIQKIFGNATLKGENIYFRQPGDDQIYVVDPGFGQFRDDLARRREKSKESGKGSFIGDFTGAASSAVKEGAADVLEMLPGAQRLLTPMASGAAAIQQAAPLTSMIPHPLAKAGANAAVGLVGGAAGQYLATAADEGLRQYIEDDKLDLDKLGATAKDKAKQDLLWGAVFTAGLGSLAGLVRAGGRGIVARAGARAIEKLGKDPKKLNPDQLFNYGWEHLNQRMAKLRKTVGDKFTFGQLVEDPDILDAESRIAKIAKRHTAATEAAEDTVIERAVARPRSDFELRGKRPGEAPDVPSAAEGVPLPVNRNTNTPTPLGRSSVDDLEQQGVASIRRVREAPDAPVAQAQEMGSDTAIVSKADDATNPFGGPIKPGQGSLEAKQQAVFAQDPAAARVFARSQHAAAQQKITTGLRDIRRSFEPDSKRKAELYRRGTKAIIEARKAGGVMTPAQESELRELIPGFDASKIRQVGPNTAVLEGSNVIPLRRSAASEIDEAVRDSVESMASRTFKSADPQEIATNLRQMRLAGPQGSKAALHTALKIRGKYLRPFLKLGQPGKKFQTLGDEARQALKATYTDPADFAHLEEGIEVYENLMSGLPRRSPGKGAIRQALDAAMELATTGMAAAAVSSISPAVGIGAGATGGARFAQRMMRLKLHRHLVKFFKNQHFMLKRLSNPKAMDAWLKLNGKRGTIDGFGELATVVSQLTGRTFRFPGTGDEDQ